jgi:CRISPR-associated protein Csy3
MATTNNTLKTATVLAFERKLDPSDAVFFSGTWGKRSNSAQWQPIPVREKAIRGTISNRMKTKKTDDATEAQRALEAALDADYKKPNLQTVDVAALPPEADTLMATFTLRILPGAGTPNACNNEDYRTKLLSTVLGYTGFGELAMRYAHNLANGRFLWRNRVGAEQVEVQVQHLVQGVAHKTWTFDALSLSLRNFSAEGAADALKELGELIAQGLAGASHVLLQVTAFARVGAGQEVYPSQELILDKGNSGKSKTLYVVNGVAGIHSQKLGNAIRTIDTWHPDVEKLGPIAVEPYGSVTTLGKACRRPTDKLDFYNLLDGWILKDEVPPVEQKHFVMATLIRGGVFGDASKE